jgi:hypothetical protein
VRTGIRTPSPTGSSPAWRGPEHQRSMARLPSLPLGLHLCCAAPSRDGSPALQFRSGLCTRALGRTPIDRRDSRHPPRGVAQPLAGQGGRSPPVTAPKCPHFGSPGRGKPPLDAATAGEQVTSRVACHAGRAAESPTTHTRVLPSQGPPSRSCHACRRGWPAALGRETPQPTARAVCGVRHARPL